MSEEQPKTPEQLANERIQEMLDGKLAPPNEFVGYMIDEFKAVKDEAIQLNKLIGETRERLKMMEARNIALVAKQRQYIDDIAKWDKKLAAVGPSPEIGEPVISLEEKKKAVDVAASRPKKETKP